MFDIGSSSEINARARSFSKLFKALKIFKKRTHNYILDPGFTNCESQNRKLWIVNCERIPNLLN